MDMVTEKLHMSYKKTCDLLLVPMGILGKKEKEIHVFEVLWDQMSR